MADRNCKDCIWNSESGCMNWDCEPVTRQEARKYFTNPKTNGDRIRRMTDEELTMFLAETSRCSDWCNLYEKCKTKTNCSYSVCLETWNDWLKEECE